MEISSLIRHELTPCVITGIVFGFAGHYFEAKPVVIILGIIGIFLTYFMSNKEDKVVQSDMINLKSENESLKQNLMQVYSMVKNQTQEPVSGPPPPIPPSMTAVPERKSNEEDEPESKPYL